MRFPRPTLRFGLRTILVVVAVLACFLGWRLWDFEKSAVAAIEREGGTVYFHYQRPSVSSIWFSVAMIPHLVYLDMVRIEASPRSGPPQPTLRELIGGTYIAKHVSTVDIPLDKMTPEMVARLQSLPDLEAVVVRVNGGVMLRTDSPEARQLAALWKEFPQKLHPTYASKPE